MIQTFDKVGYLFTSELNVKFINLINKTTLDTCKSKIYIYWNNRTIQSIVKIQTNVYRFSIFFHAVRLTYFGKCSTAIIRDFTYSLFIFRILHRCLSFEMGTILVPAGKSLPKFQ